jgi:trigger factor
MQVKVEKISETKYKLIVAIDEATLKLAKEHSITKLGQNVKVAGFRPGKAPSRLVEKAIDQQQLQTEFIDDALNHAYRQAVTESKIRPILPPTVSLTKFVPFSTLEFTADVEVLGKITVADYKKLKLARPTAKVEVDEVDKVIVNMQRQMAEKTEVKRPAKNDDEVWIDFEGVDAKKKPVKGADGKDYPLLLGSKTFIPGFEEKLVGSSAGDEKTFTLTFPSDYGIKAMQGKKVTFKVTVKTVKEVKLPEINDEFVKKVSPVKTVKELKDDIKKELGVEKQKQVDNDFEAEVINTVTAKSKLDIPEGLLAEQADAILAELQRNITYRGLTMQEYLDDAGMTAEEQKAKEIMPEAERRLKAGLVLSEIAEKEGIVVADEELENRLQNLKAQYQNDAKMIAELEKPENRGDIAARLLTEKTIIFLVDQVSKN